MKLSLSKHHIFLHPGIGVIARHPLFLFLNLLFGGERIKPRGYSKIPVGIMFLTAYLVKLVYLKAKFCHGAAALMHYSVNLKRCIFRLSVI